ncbi:MAG: glycosyltransferase family A protein, partial [Candidatus Limnocylindrales bacterium]
MVIAVYNGAATLPAALGSLARQDFRSDWECVLVDNGSSDRSYEIAGQWSDQLPLRWIVADAERGQVYARNHGASEARGKYLVFLDQDDEVGPGYLDGMASALKASDFVAARLDRYALNAPEIAASRSPA